MIIRRKLQGNYTRIPNEFLLDETISDKARGTLARLLSRPDSWNVNVNHLVKTGKDGHTALRSSLTELEDAGYLHKKITRGDGGRITGTRYFVFDHRVTPETARGTHINNDNSMRKTPIRETEDVITNKGNNKLGVTTTTTPDQPKEEFVIEAPPLPSSYPATEDINSLLDLIPEQHQQPMVKALINRVVREYSPLELEEAIVYASANVRGGAMQFKAYLDKTLKNQWATGYLEQTTSPSEESILAKYGIGRQAGKYPNGTVTGSARMDSNYQAAAEFLARRRGRHDQ